MQNTWYRACPWAACRWHYHHYRDGLNISSESTSTPSGGGLTKQELRPKLRDPPQILPTWWWWTWTALKKVPYSNCGINTYRSEPWSSKSRFDDTKMIAQIMKAALVTGLKTWVGADVRKRCTGRWIRKDIRGRGGQWYKGGPWSGQQPTASCWPGVPGGIWYSCRGHAEEISKINMVTKGENAIQPGAQGKKKAKWARKLSPGMFIQ